MYVQQFATNHPKENAMNIHPVHYAPHHTGHLPLCGAAKEPHGLLIGTMERDDITCFKCIDQYEERAMTPAQVAALTQVRDDIDSIFAELEELIVFDQMKHATLHAVDRMIEGTPWWHPVLRFRLVRARRELAAVTLADVKR